MDSVDDRRGIVVSMIIVGGLLFGVVACQRLTLPWVITLSFSFPSAAHVITITCWHLFSFESWSIMTFFCSFSPIYSHPVLERQDSLLSLAPSLVLFLRFSSFFEIKKTFSLSPLDRLTSLDTWDLPGSKHRNSIQQRSSMMLDWETERRDLISSSCSCIDWDRSECSKQQ